VCLAYVLVVFDRYVEEKVIINTSVVVGAAVDLKCSVSVPDDGMKANRKST